MMNDMNHLIRFVHYFIPVISFTNASPNPRTMMIKFHDAIITIPAMRGARRSKYVAKLNFYLIVTSGAIFYSKQMRSDG